MASPANSSSPKRISEIWRGFAEAYANLGPPLAPCAEDRQFMEQAARNWAAGHPGERLMALLLGVTPLLARMAWPAGAFLTAADRSHAMIGAIWPGDAASVRGAVQADWLALPVRDRSLDLVLGDGLLNGLRYPEGYRALALAVRAVLKSGGILALRAFVRPLVSEDPRLVIAEIVRSATFHQFKLRLLMAMQPSPEVGCDLSRVHRYWTACAIDRAALALQTGWRREEIDTIDRYRGLDEIYTFPTLEELRSLLAEFFTERSVLLPSYPMAECCPTLVMQA